MLDDFKQVVTQPKAILIGLVLQLLMLPGVAFIIAYLSPIDPAFKVGIVIIAACPGGTSSNLVSHMIRAKVALSVSLTAFNSFLILISIPAILSVAISFFMSSSQDIVLSFWETLANILGTVILPVVIGMAVKHRFEAFAQKVEKYSDYILPLILILIFVVASGSSFAGESSISDLLLLSIPLIILNLGSMLLGYAISRRAGLAFKKQLTISIEIGLQNSALAIFIASQLIGNDKMTQMAIIYSSFSFFTTFGFAYLIKRNQGRRTETLK